MLHSIVEDAQTVSSKLLIYYMTIIDQKTEKSKEMRNIRGIRKISTMYVENLSMARWALVAALPLLPGSARRARRVPMQRRYQCRHALRCRWKLHECIRRKISRTRPDMRLVYTYLGWGLPLRTYPSSTVRYEPYQIPGWWNRFVACCLCCGVNGTGGVVFGVDWEVWCDL